MRRSSPDSAGANVRSLTKGALHGRMQGMAIRRRSTAVARCVAAAGILTAAIAFSASPAMALGVSHNVAVIPSSQPVPAEGQPPSQPDGILPTTSDVAGNPAESFSKFSFTNVGLDQITPAELSQFDTVVLNEVKIKAISPSAKAALAQFVANGGKLLIHDADATNGNDYSWILGSPPGTTQVGAGCFECGAQSTTPSSILANTALISGIQGAPSFVDLNDLNAYTDALGDSNLLTSSQERRWVTAVSGTNANNESGAQLAYVASGKGLAVYNGFDTDMIMNTGDSPNPASPTGSPWRCVLSPNTHFFCPANATHAAQDWLAQMYYNELNLSAVPTTPGTTPVSTIGTPVSPTQAGLPPATSCVAKQSLRLRLLNLVRHHRNLVRIDVYVNGRHRLKESVRFVHVKIHGHRRLVRRGRFHNVTLRNLPKTGSVVIKIVGTTSRHYHLISKQTYRAC
jgi:hypothetical protein